MIEAALILFGWAFIICALVAAGGFGLAYLVVNFIDLVERLFDGDRRD